MSIRLAKKQALKSSFKQHRVGAVIVKGGRVLSTGFNEIAYSKHIGKPTVHAEERAVVKLLARGQARSLAGSTIYVSRFTRGGAVGLAAPCSRCRELLRAVGISSVVYTTNGDVVGKYKL